MSKQKSNKQQNRISPERYVRERARNLPIYKCWVNDDWNDMQSATVFVARKHVSGNITFGVYIVDLLCLGVRRTLFKYNVSEEKLMELLENGSQNHLTFKEISYNLAHNIIYASIEYADEYGFNPDADFTHVTQYLLEEDDEKIPLIEIHCGDAKGRPFYMNFSLDTPAQEKQIIAQLEKTAGHGNYNFSVLNRDNDNDDFDDDDFDDDDFDDDDDDNDNNNNVYGDKIQQLMDEFRLFDDDQLKATYFESYDKFELHKDQYKEYGIVLIAMVTVILERIVNEKKVQKYFEMYMKYFNVKVVDLFDLPNSTLDLQYDDVEKLENLYDEVLDELDAGDQNNPLEKFRKEAGDIPYIYYIKLSYSNLPDIEYDKQLNEYAQKYPDYLLFKINKYARNTKFHKKLKTLLSKVKGPITGVEFVEYLRCYALSCIVKPNIDVNELIAFDFLVRYFNQKGFSLDHVIAYLFMVKLTVVRMYYEK